MFCCFTIIISFSEQLGNLSGCLWKTGSFTQAWLSKWSLFLKEAIYSLLYRVFHLHLDSAKHLSMTHLSSRCTSMNIELETFVSDKHDSNISKKGKNLLSLSPEKDMHISFLLQTVTDVWKFLFLFLSFVPFAMHAFQRTLGLSFPK